MLRPILFIPMLLLSFSIADIENQVIYDKADIRESLILKLEIHELREKNSQLQKIIDNFKTKPKEEHRREEAILQLKRDLKKSRRRVSPQLMLLR